MVITYIRGLIAPLISTNEPPSKDPKSVGFSRSDGVSLPVCKFTSTAQRVKSQSVGL